VRTRSVRLAAVPLPALALALGALLPDAGVAADLIAPAPPDAIELRGVARSEHRVVFLSKRSPAELAAYYAGRGSPLAGRSGLANAATSPVLLSYQQVVDRLLARHGDVTLAEDLRVTVRWKPPANGQAQCAGEFLREPMAIARLQHREAEFEALCAQYGYLQNAFFQRVADPHRPGQLIDADKPLLERAHQQRGGAQSQALASSSAQTAQQIAHLALTGHANDANALAAQFNQQAGSLARSVGDWDGWVQVLHEADAVAFRTWVEIPTDPATW